MLNTFNTNTDDNIKQIEQIAHQLAHTLRNQDTDEFLNLYDQIPTQLNITQIKERALELSEQPLIEFQSNCYCSNKMNQSEQQNDCDITRFFNDKSNATNPVYNPLLLTSNNKFHNVKIDANKCRFDTNQLYQSNKDSKHNECVLSSCFDEIVEANQTDNESDDDDKKLP